MCPQTKRKHKSWVYWNCHNTSDKPESLPPRQECQSHYFKNPETVSREEIVIAKTLEPVPLEDHDNYNKKETVVARNLEPVPLKSPANYRKKKFVNVKNLEPIVARNLRKMKSVNNRKKKFANMNHFITSKEDFEPRFPTKITKLNTLMNLTETKSKTITVNLDTTLPISDNETKEETISTTENLKPVPTLKPRKMEIQTENIPVEEVPKDKYSFPSSISVEEFPEDNYFKYTRKIINSVEQRKTNGP